LEAGIRVAVRVEELLAALEVADGEFAQDPHALVGVVVVAGAALGAALPDGSRLEDDDADRMNVIVVVEAGVGALNDPVVAEDQAVVAGVLRSRIGGGHFARRHCSVGIALPLVEARAADEPEG
jgi:hypothetical protein